MNASNNIFVCKYPTTPEEYLKDMISCISEDGTLEVKRDYEEGCYFVTASEAENDSPTDEVDDDTLIEKFSLDKKLADYDSVYAYYQHVLKGLEDGSIWKELASDVMNNEYARRIRVFAKRLKKLISLKAPPVSTDNEKIMLIDSVLLYKTEAKSLTSPVFFIL